MRLEKHCHNCEQVLVLVDPKNDIPSHALRYVELMCFKENALVFASKAAYDSLLCAEKLFQQTKSSLQKSVGVKEKLLKAVLHECEVAFPSCHDLKRSLLNRFLGLRLHIFAKHSINGKSNVKNAPSSKSVAMRVAVQRMR